MGSTGITPTPPPGSTLGGCTGTTPTPPPGSTLRGSGGSTLRWSGGSTERPEGVGGHFGTTLASTSGFTSAEVVCVFAPSSSPSFVALWLVVVTTVIAGNPKAVTPLLGHRCATRFARGIFHRLALRRRLQRTAPARQRDDATADRREQHGLHGIPDHAPKSLPVNLQLHFRFPFVFVCSAKGKRRPRRLSEAELPS